MDLVRQYLDEARQLDAKYAAQADKVRQDRDLSLEGKAKRLQQIAAERRQAIEGLQGRAALAVDIERRRLQDTLKAERLRQAEDRRLLLGDALYAQVLRDELSVMSAQEIKQRYLSASSPWERQLVFDYGTLQLRRRTADRTPDADEFDAMQALRQDVPATVRQAEQQLQQLDSFDVASLDRQAVRADIADRYGVNESLVPDVDGAE